MLKLIVRELKSHAPFTFLGAVFGIVLMVTLNRLPHASAERLFYVFHPLHVLLSALTTATMYKIHQCPLDKKKCNIIWLLCLGYVGSIGIATLSDSLIPYLGEMFLNMPHREMHVGFLEEPWLINAMAFLGVMIAYYNPSTKFPHFGHILLSTAASLFHMIMAQGGAMSFGTYLIMLLFLFVSVWLPCCVSDIVFPLLFIKDKDHQHTHEH